MIYQIISFIQNIWAKYKMFVIINVILLGAFLFFVLPLILPKPPLEVKRPNLQGMDEAIGGVSVELKMKEPAVPARLKLYRMSENFSQDEQVFADIAARLKVNTVLEPDLRVNDDESLALDATQHRLSYTKSIGDDTKTVNTSPLNLETAKKQTEDWLTTVGLTDIEANTLGTRYYLNVDPHEGFTETEPSKANIIRFTFNRKLNGLDLAFGAASAQPAYVTVTNDGVTQADIPAFVATFTADQERDLLPFSQVIENVKIGNYTFARTIEAVAEDTRDTQPVKFQITGATLIYRVDITQRAAIPYWNFTGTATLRNEQTVPLEITSPAVTL